MTTYPFSKTYKVEIFKDPKWTYGYDYAREEATEEYKAYREFRREYQVAGNDYTSEKPIRPLKHYRFENLEAAYVVELPTIVSDKDQVETTEDGRFFRIRTVTVDLRWHVAVRNPAVTFAQTDEVIVVGDRYRSIQGWDTEKEALAEMRRMKKSNGTRDKDDAATALIKDEIARLARIKNVLAIYSCPNDQTVPGDVVAFRGHGTIRAGIVIDFTKARVKVAYASGPLMARDGWKPYVKWINRSTTAKEVN